MNGQDDIASAFRAILESLEAEIGRVDARGASAFAAGNHQAAASALEAANRLQALKERVEQLQADLAEPRSAELIKPWLRGRDIKRWKPEWAGLYCIHVPWHLKPEEYPGVIDHLSLHRDKLAARPEVRRNIHPWFAMSRWAAEYYQEFERPKVVWPEFARQIRFCAVEEGFYLNNKCYFWADAPLWALAILNSELVEFLLCMITSQLRGGFLQLYDHFVRRLPFVVPGEEECRSLSDLVQGLHGDQAGKEQEIEEAVRSLYRLSAEEGTLVDNWFQRRSLASDEDATAGEEDEDDD